jgi:hypothetical protein
MTQMDAYRIRHNHGYMVRSIPQLKEEQYVTAAKAVVEHHLTTMNTVVMSNKRS